MVSLIVPLDMPGFGNEKHIILDSNLLVGYLAFAPHEKSLEVLWYHSLSR